MKLSIKLLTLLIAIFLILAGCSSNNEDTDDNTIEEENDITLEADEENAKELEEHENVDRVIIQLETAGGNDYVNADITLASEVDGEEAAEEFSNMLKEMYPNRIIDLILIYEGQSIYQGTFE